MVKSQQTRNKQEKEKQKQKKKKDKAARKLERQAESRDGDNLSDMIAYVDEYGRITSTPPDPTVKDVINLEDIDINVRNKNVVRTEDVPSTGVVSFYNDSKGYGFIKDSVTRESLFFHVNSVEGQIKEGDIVSFAPERSAKGMNASNIKIIKGS